MSSTEPTQIFDYPFNYIPSFAAGVTFVVLFSFVTGLHLGQALHRRMWWLLPTVVTGGIGETIGWVGRLWGSKDPISMDPYLMQITTTIISPTFVLAANFVIVIRIIQKLGPQYSRLSPRLYTIVFCSCDVIALIVQSVGGAMASLAKDQPGIERGGHIALGGIVFQFASIVVYMVLTSEFLIRSYLDRPFTHRRDTFIGGFPRVDFETKQMIFGVSFSSLCMFIRGVYRTIELTDGWGGKIISNELLFIGFDGSMIILSMAVLNVFHPGRLMTGEIGLMRLASRVDIEMFSKGI
ncbi:RTA1-domain-containing protein [Thelephora ganbajun]|uniref:RTA1-domain-containing protein n=1 Tax=Thelephora ganbajun TaxID=370292 RepID=A0ACB6Z856_THEGA|nr:RTA1-domain-containing protein [Thelephora ganbajun]